MKLSNIYNILIVVKDIIRRIKNSNRLIKALWAVTIIAFIFISCMHTYNDILVTGKQGIVFWDILFSGKILSFYKEAFVYSGNPYYPVEQYALYPFLYYLIFAIFEFPLWLIEKVFTLNVYNTIFGNIYNKFILLFFVVMDLIALSKVLKELEKNEEEINIYSLLYVSSMTVITSTYITGQYDVANIFFILMGFYYWLKKDTKRFIIYFSISINLKYFGLLFFVPLLLIEEKNIYKIFAKGMQAIVPTLVLMLVFSVGGNASSGGVGTTIVTMYISKFIVNDLAIGNHEVSSFILISIISCVIAYFYNYKNDKERTQLAIFVLLMQIGSFCFIARIIAYWAVLGVPVFILAIALSNNNENKMLFFETILGLSLALYQYFFFNWMFCAKTTSAMGILPNIFNKWPDTSNNTGVDGVLMSLGLGPEVMNIVYIFTLAAWLIMMYYCFPGRKNQDNISDPIKKETIIFRTIMNIGLAFLPIVSAIYIYIMIY